jgi:hypothetical protein
MLVVMKGWGFEKVFLLDVFIIIDGVRGLFVQSD